MVKLVQDVQPSGVASAYVGAPFDEAKAELELQGYEVISSQENARLRIEQGKSSDVSRNGNYVKEGTLCVPKKGRFFTKNSLVMQNPKGATEAHRQGNEFYVNNDQVEEVLADSVQVSYDKSEVPTNRFGEDEVSVFVFGEQAKTYGDFLKDVGINEMLLWLNDKDYVDNRKSFANQLWLYSMDNGFDIGCCIRDLDCNYSVRGVKNTTGEASSQKVEAYTINDIQKVLKNTGITGNLEKTILGELRK